MKNYSHQRPGFQDYEFNTGIIGNPDIAPMNLGGSAIARAVKSVVTSLTTRPVKEVSVHLHQHIHYHVNGNQIERKG